MPLFLRLSILSLLLLTKLFDKVLLLLKEILGILCFNILEIWLERYSVIKGIETNFLLLMWLFATGKYNYLVLLYFILIKSLSIHWRVICLIILSPFFKLSTEFGIFNKRLMKQLKAVILWLKWWLEESGMTSSVWVGLRCISNSKTLCFLEILKSRKLISLSTSISRVNSIWLCKLLMSMKLQNFKFNLSVKSKVQFSNQNSQFEPTFLSKFVLKNWTSFFLKITIFYNVSIVLDPQMSSGKQTEMFFYIQMLKSFHTFLICTPSSLKMFLFTVMYADFLNFR